MMRDREWTISSNPSVRIDGCDLVVQKKMKKVVEIFCSFEKKLYLCTREMKEKNVSRVYISEIKTQIL